MTSEYWDAKDKKISRQWAMNVATQLVIGQNSLTQALNAEEMLKASKKLVPQILEWLESTGEVHQ